jgi:RimJ/RimL family protein N-acetyltransferase
VTRLAGTEVLLRPIELGDVDALVAARAEDAPGSFGPSGDEARTQLRKLIERKPTLEDGGFLSLVVEAGGEVVGDIQARAPKHGFPPGVCEIGISLVSAVRGKGYGREAVALFTAHLHEAGWPRVQASTDVENVAMRRVLERCGYVFEGVLRSYTPADDDGARGDSAMYASFRTKDDGDLD